MVELTLTANLGEGPWAAAGAAVQAAAEHGEFAPLTRGHCNMPSKLIW